MQHIFLRMSLPSSPNQLALLRIFIALTIFLRSQSYIFDLLQVIPQKHDYLSTIFPEKINIFISSNITVIQNTVLATSFFVMIGLFTRFFLPIFTISFIFLYNFYYLGVGAPVVWLYFWFPLVILSFSKCNHAFSVDQLFFKYKQKNLLDYRWPVEFMTLWIVYIYLSAGIAKIFPTDNLVLYLNGETIRQIFFNRYPDSPIYFISNSILFDLSSNNLLFSTLALLGILVEISTLVIIFSSKFNFLFIIVLSLFHIFLYLFGVQGFLLTFLVLAISLLPNNYFKTKQIK